MNIPKMTDLQSRQHLDKLFLIDSSVSIIFGSISLLIPHGLLTSLSGGYNHNTHEVLRLYGCLRIAVGWILWHIRTVDDGRFRRSVCEALFVCYLLQAMAVLRAQFTQDHSTIHAYYLNWMAIILLVLIGGSYGRFRFSNGGNLIKLYELPVISSKSHR